MTGTITAGRGVQRWRDSVGGSSGGEGQEVLVGYRGVDGAEQMRVEIDGVEARGLRGYETRSRCCAEEGHTAPRHVAFPVTTARPTGVTVHASPATHPSKSRSLQRALHVKENDDPGLGGIRRVCVFAQRGIGFRLVF